MSNLITNNNIGYQFSFDNLRIVTGFVGLITLSTLLVKAGQYLLISEDLYFNAYSDQISYESIRSLIDNAREWEWLNYISIPVAYIVKLSSITIVLGLGAFLSADQFYCKRFLEAAIFAELIFFVPIVMKILWFVLVQTDYTLQDLSLFYPLSVLSLFEQDALPKYLLYPLQTLNLFEVAYWFLLAHGVADVTGFSFKRSFGLVMSSYGVGLVLWVVLVMFLTITYS